MGNIVLNINEILKECGVEDDNPQTALKKIAGLEEFYDTADIIEIYNYILSTVKDYDILYGVIKLADAHKSESILSVLLDLLLTNESEHIDSDDLINLRVLCAKSISQYKDASTLGTLLYCLNNKQDNYQVRLACADALGRIGDTYAVNSLINIIKDEDEKSIYVKESATFALGLLGDKSAITPLVEIMETMNGIWDKFSFLKEKIIEALGKLNLNNSNVLKVYKNSLLDDSPMVRISTIEALMNSEYEEAPTLIKELLHDNDIEVCKNALIALYNIMGRDILDEVISLPGYSKELKEEAKYLIDEYEEED